MLFGAHSSTGAGAGCAIDWLRQRAWLYGTNGFLSNINILSGNETAFGSVPAQCNSSPLGIDANGNLYLSNGGLMSGGETSIDGGTVLQITTTTWPVNVFGGGDIANVPVGSSQYMVDTGVGTSLGVLSRVNVALNTTNLLNQDWLWGPNSWVCQGPNGADYGFMVNGSNSNEVKLFTVEVTPSPGQTLLGTYVPTDIDVTWTGLTIGGICIDQTDENPIIEFYTSGAATNAYIVKINGLSGTIIWKAALPAPTAPIVGRDWKHTSIQHGFLYIMTPSHFGSPPVEISTINTATGAITSTSSGMAGVNPVYGPQVSNDSLGTVALQCDYNRTAGGPVPLNSTPNSFTDRWGLLYVAPAILSAPMPTPGARSPFGFNPNPHAVINFGPPWSNVPSPLEMTQVTELC
jgi:hypothetical protein